MYFLIAINRQCRGAVFVNAVLLLLYYEMRLAEFYFNTSGSAAAVNVLSEIISAVAAAIASIPLAVG